MRKHLIITLAIAGLAVSACGSKDGYRGVKATISEKTKDKEKTPVAPPAEPSTEAKAIALLAKDQNHQLHQNTDTTQRLQNELLGASLQVVAQDVAPGVSLTQVELSYITSQNVSCNPVTALSNQFHVSNLAKQTTVIKDTGRVTCVDEKCNDLVVIIEKSTTKIENYNITPDIGSVAVLMTKDADGTYKPVVTESELFAKVDVLEARVEKCVADKKEADEAKLAAEKAKQEEAAQQRKAQVKARMEAIKARMSVIDGELAKLRSGTIAMSEAARDGQIKIYETERVGLMREFKDLDQSL